jgi:hypothetical protein
MNVDNVSRDDWILGAVALLLAIDLLFLPWFDISASAGPISISVTSTATGSPDGWLGVLAVITAVAVIVDLGLERLSPQTQVPAIGGSRTSTRFILAVATAVFVALKFLFHIHFSLFGFGFYAAVVLTVALVYFAYQAREATVTVGTPRGPGVGTGGPGVGTGGPGVGTGGPGVGTGGPGVGTGAPGAGTGGPGVGTGEPDPGRGSVGPPGSV